VHSMTNLDPTWTTPRADEIRALLIDRIEVRRRGVGVVVAVIDSEGQRIVAHGTTDRTDGQAVNGHTVFEVGSTTKAFTSLLLAEMAQRGEVAFADPVSDYLPKGVTVPARGGRRITLIDLATHTSGLPFMDPAFLTRDPEHPHRLAGQAQALAEYTVQRMYRFLSDYSLPREIGDRFEYSNLGAGLLGHALALRAGVDYETLVAQRITRPLGMSSTAINLSDSLASRFATGHDQALRPVPRLEVSALPGAGALCSTANDLLSFLAAELGFVAMPLRAAMSAQLEPRRRTLRKQTETALGWYVSATRVGEIVWHTGGTVGSATFLGFDRARRVGVVVLANSHSGDNLGHYVLAGLPLASARTSA